MYISILHYTALPSCIALRDGPLEKWKGGGDFLSGNIFFFCTPIEEIFFFSLDGWKDFFFWPNYYWRPPPPRRQKIFGQFTILGVKKNFPELLIANIIQFFGEIGTTSFIWTTNRAAFFPFWVHRETWQLCFFQGSNFFFGTMPGKIYFFLTFCWG
jgi:hypothetical protein